MFTYVNFSALQHHPSVVSAPQLPPTTLCPEIPSHFFKSKKAPGGGQNPEYLPDQKSTQGFDRVDDSSDWRHLVKVIKDRLAIRGIVKDETYISDYLRVYSNGLQDEIDAENEADKAAEIAEFNLHIAKLKPDYAAILILAINHHWTFPRIAELLNVCPQQAANEFHDAEEYFNSDLIQVHLIGHEITLETPVSELINILVNGARPGKSNAGRKPKPKKSPKTEDIFEGVV